MPAKIFIPQSHLRIFLAAIAMLAGVAFHLNEAFPQTGGRIKIGLPDFSLSFYLSRLRNHKGFF